MVEIFRMNFKNKEKRNMMTDAIENHHSLFIKLWFIPYAETDKTIRMMNNIKYLKDAPTSRAASFNWIAFILIASEFIYVCIVNLNSQYII